MSAKAAGSKKSAREQIRAERAKQAEAAQRRDNLTKVGIGVAVVLIVVVIFGLVQWQRSQIDTTAEFPRQVAAGADSQGEAGVGDGVGVGSPDAPVVVELFEDFSCPHCAEFEAEAPELLKPYIQKDQVRVVYYPMTLGSFTRAGYGNDTAANAFGCAADEEGPSKVAAYHETLFANQQNWNENLLIDLANQSGIDSGKFEACVRNNSFGEWVRAIDQTATDRGVSGTPTAFVDGERVEYQTMTELIEGIRAGIEKGLD
jgi:protein-disulfide isomerase